MILKSVDIPTASNILFIPKLGSGKHTARSYAHDHLFFLYKPPANSPPYFVRMVDMGMIWASFVRRDNRFASLVTPLVWLTSLRHFAWIFPAPLPQRLSEPHPMVKILHAQAMIPAARRLIWFFLHTLRLCFWAADTYNSYLLIHFSNFSQSNSTRFRQELRRFQGILP